MNAFDRDYFDKRRRELAEQGVTLDCPALSNYGPRPYAMGVYKGALTVWFTEPDARMAGGHWHLHISVQGWWVDRETFQRDGGNRVAEWEGGNGMRLLRPETLAEAIDTAVEIVTSPALVRKHRDYYLSKRVLPALKSAEEHLARLQAVASNLDTISLDDDILDSKQPAIQRRIPGIVLVE